ncbi:hypothetical protein ACS0TY_014782 [Phlomoides rotata]
MVLPGHCSDHHPILVQARLTLEAAELLYIQNNIASDGDTTVSFEVEIDCQSRKSSHSMNSMYIGDVLSHDSNAICQHVVEYYYELFSERATQQHDFSILNQFISSVISDEHNDCLVGYSAIPSNNEIKFVVFDMDGYSAPGPDGFGDCFFHSCWAIVVASL